MTSLEINFHGPIVFRLCKDVAWAYLPKCEDHYCNILTDTNDISPKRRRIFEVLGPKSAPTKSGGEGSPMVERKWNWGEGPRPEKCYCIFKLPSPDRIFGLRGEYVKIDIPGEQGLEGNYARGLRFYYSECSVAPTIIPQDGAAAGDLHKFCAKYWGHSDLYQTEIRYHDTKRQPTIDHHHRDAMKCSRSMRKLFPPCDKWKVNFEPPKKEGLAILIGGKHPVDCGANLLVFSDGIVL
jgi:hypothetical protein